MNLNSLPFVGTFIKRFDHDLSTVGMQTAMRNMLKRSGTKLKVTGMTDTLEKILKTKPVVVVCNHPFEAEVIALIASLPSRDDAYLIVNDNFVGTCPHFDKFLIPVYLYHRRVALKNRSLYHMLFHILQRRKQYSYEASHEKNIESINTAAKNVKKGGLVVIFPGVDNKSKHWFKGVGHLIKGLGANTDAYIVKAFVEGTSQKDVLRIIPYVSTFLPGYKATFAKPIKIKDFFVNDGKKITALIEEQYNSWIKNMI
ncbi:MAG: hypothetical protein ABIO02_04495 [Patescibacteria group bacterium]